MKQVKKSMFTAVAVLLLATVCAMADQTNRVIRIINDNGQYPVVSRVFQLKYIHANVLEPYIKQAMYANGDVAAFKDFTYAKGNKQYIAVSTSPDVMGSIEDLIKTLDQPGQQMDKYGSSVQGDGIYDFAYKPKYQSSQSLLRSMKIWPAGDISGYFIDGYTNSIYWKDDYGDGSGAIDWLKKLDVPTPQVQVKLNVYELNDSQLRQLGINWLDWKNGPGANLFSVGANMFSFGQDSSAMSSIPSLASHAAGAFGGFLFAPQFDASYIKMLAQKGKARDFSSGWITVMNQLKSRVDGDNTFGDASGDDGLFSYTLKVTTNDQFLSQDQSNMEIAVNENPITFELTLKNPIITHPDSGNNTVSALDAAYVLNNQSTVSVEQNTSSTPLTNSSTFNSSFFALSGTDQLLGSFNKEFNVKQKEGLPWLSELPVLEYIFGSVSKAKGHSQIFVTLSVRTVTPHTQMTSDQNSTIKQFKPVNEKASA